MLIDVNNLVLGDSEEFAFSQSMQPNGVPAKVSIKGILTYTKEGYVLKGNINAVLSLVCDKCLDSFTSELDLPFDEVFSNAEPEADSEKEFWNFSDKSIDLKPAVEANILLNMPMKAVCSDNCKGLCPVCGHNLNKGDCGCDRGYSNPVFENLMTLFEDPGNT